MTPKFPPHIRGAVLSILSHPSASFYGAVTLYRAAFQQTLKSRNRTKRQCYNTTFLTSYNARFGLSCAAFARCYSRHLNWFLFLALLECFVSRRSLPFRAWWEVSFRNLRFNRCMRFAGAYRSLPRPSSASEPSHPPNSLITTIFFCWVNHPMYAAFNMKMSSQKPSCFCVSNF